MEGISSPEVPARLVMSVEADEAQASSIGEIDQNELTLSARCLRRRCCWVDKRRAEFKMEVKTHSCRADAS